MNTTGGTIGGSNINSTASGDGSGGLAPRSSSQVDPTASVPENLRARIDRSTSAAQSYTRVVYKDDKESQPALVIGKQVSDPNGDAYQLYYLFPLTQEEKSLSLVKGTLATAGLFVVVLLGAIAWLVVRRPGRLSRVLGLPSGITAHTATWAGRPRRAWKASTGRRRTPQRAYRAASV